MRSSSLWLGLLLPTLAYSATSVQVRLSWPAVPGATTYVIERRDGPDDAAPWVPVEVVTAGTMQAPFIQTGLALNTRYCWQVRAKTAGGVSRPGPMVCRTATPPTPAPPEPPPELSATLVVTVDGPPTAPGAPRVGTPKP